MNTARVTTAMSHGTSALPGVLFVLLVLSGWAQAHQGASGLVKERMDQMEAMGKAMKALKHAYASGDKVDAALVRQQAATIKKAAAQIPQLFPEGSNHPPSESKPQIWIEWDRFVGIAAELELIAEALGKSAKSGMTAPHGGMSEASNSGVASTLGGAAIMGVSAQPPLEDSAALEKLSSRTLFERMGRSCKSCHTDYRQKKD